MSDPVPTIFNDLSAFPPGGWEFVQPELGWRAPSPLSEDFYHLVDRVVALRMNNPRFGLSVNPIEVAAEIQAYNCPKDPSRCHARGNASTQPYQAQTALAFRPRKRCASCGR